MQLGVDEINGAGGIAGKWTMELDIRNTNRDPAQTAAATQQLVDSGVSPATGQRACARRDLCAPPALLIAMTLFLSRTTLGISIRAAAQDFQVTRLMGIRANAAIAAVFAASGIPAGIAGVLWVAQRAIVDPFMGPTPVLAAVVAAVVGGLGSLPGAVVAAYLLGSILVTFLGEALRGIEAGLQLGPWSVGPVFGATQVILALLMLGVMFFRPHGLVGLREPDEIIAGWWRRRNEQRR